MPLFQVGPKPCDMSSPEYLSQNLEAFWPGLLSMVGDNEAALKSLHNYHQVIKSLLNHPLTGSCRFGSSMASHQSSTMWLKEEWLRRGRASLSDLSS